MTGAPRPAVQAHCLCSSARLVQLPRPIFGNGRRLHRCSHCGLHQLAPYPVATNTDDGIYNADGYLDSISDAEYYGYFRALFDSSLAPLLQPWSRILDFGAGSCHYQHFLAQHGQREVYSLEINPHMARLARERFGLDRVVTRFHDLPDQPFDLIFANQVFEHIYDPLALMRGEMFKRLAPGGHLVLSVPNFDSLNRAVLGPRWIGYSPAEHIWFFTADWFRRQFTPAGPFALKHTRVHSAINTPHDRFVPRSLLKRAYYGSAMRVFEWMGRGDQLIVVLQKNGTVH